jgi:hypothetical protein
MPDQNIPIPLPPPSGFLAVSGRRAVAAEMVDAASGHVTDGLFAAELLDLLAGVVLRLAGVDDNAARSILAALWTDR